jgi:tetratricopeptide (TPR) repeat protein
VGAEAAVMLSTATKWEAARFQDADHTGRLANAILKRLGPGHERLEGWLAHNQGGAHLDEGDFEQAERDIRRAVALKQKADGGDSWDVADSLMSMGLVLAARGNYADAIKTTDRARAIFERAYGPGSLHAAFALNNRGEFLNQLGRHEEALASCKQAIAEVEAVVGPENAFVGEPLTGSGMALVGLHRPREAVPLLTRALDIRERLEPNPGPRADTRFTLARALWDANGDRTRARALATAARVEYQQMHNADRQIRSVDDWLAAHPAR